MLKNVLLLDDDDVYNFLNKSLVEISGMGKEVKISKSPLEVIADLQKQETAWVPDIILLDIMMPGMNGHQFLEAFENLPSHISGHTKIAMLTSSLDPEDRAKSFNHKSVVDFIEKPLNANKLEKLKQIIAE